MDAVRIVRAGAAEAAAVAGLVAELLAEIVLRSGQARFPVDEAALSAAAAELLGQERLLAFLARQGDEAVGVATLSPGHALYAGGPLATLTELYVRPHTRGLGVGKRLIEAVAALGRERGWRRIEVTTPPLPAFETTLAFYQSRGFAVTGGRKLQASLG